MFLTECFANSSFNIVHFKYSNRLRIRLVEREPREIARRVPVPELRWRHRMSARMRRGRGRLRGGGVPAYNRKLLAADQCVIDVADHAGDRCCPVHAKRQLPSICRRRYVLSAAARNLFILGCFLPSFFTFIFLSLHTLFSLFSKWPLKSCS